MHHPNRRREGKGYIFSLLPLPPSSPFDNKRENETEQKGKERNREEDQAGLLSLRYHSVDESSHNSLHEQEKNDEQNTLIVALLTCPLHKSKLTHYCFRCCEPLCSQCLQTCKNHYVMTYEEIEEVYPYLSLSYPPLVDVAMEVRALERDRKEEQEEEEEKSTNDDDEINNNRRRKKKYALLSTALTLEEQMRTNKKKEKEQIPENVSRHCAIDITLFHFFHNSLRLYSSVDSYRAFPFVSSLPFVINAEAQNRTIEFGDFVQRVWMSEPFPLKIPCDCPGMLNIALTATGHFISLDSKTGLLRLSDLVGNKSVAVPVGRTYCALAPYYTSLALVVRGRGEVWRACVSALMKRPRRSTLFCAPGPVTMDTAYFCDTAGCSRTGVVRVLSADARILSLDLVSLVAHPIPDVHPLYIASSTDICLPGGVLVGSRNKRQAVVVEESGKCTDLVPLDSYSVVFIPSSRPEANVENGVFIDLIGQMTAMTWKTKLKKPFYFKANSSLCRVCGDVFIAYDYKSRRFVVLRVSVL